jgi:hypothetical protein
VLRFVGLEVSRVVGKVLSALVLVLVVASLERSVLFLVLVLVLVLVLMVLRPLVLTGVPWVPPPPALLPPVTAWTVMTALLQPAGPVSMVLGLLVPSPGLPQQLTLIEVEPALILLVSTPPLTPPLPKALPPLPPSATRRDLHAVPMVLLVASPLPSPGAATPAPKRTREGLRSEPLMLSATAAVLQEVTSKAVPVQGAVICSPTLI